MLSQTQLRLLFQHYRPAAGTTDVHGPSYRQCVQQCSQLQQLPFLSLPLFWDLYRGPASRLDEHNVIRAATGQSVY